MRLRYDFHLHSCLSPCGDDDMTPCNLVQMAMLCDLDIIALTDHNTAGNCRSAMEVGREVGVVVVPGMELCTAEEVHVVCLFAGIAEAEAFSAHVRENMLPFANDPDVFGRQLYMDARDGVLAEEELLLINASTLGIDQVPELVRKYGGFAYPAHVDRPSNSVISNLGTIEADMGFSCAEVSLRGNPAALAERFPALRNMRIFRSSDAHRLEDMREASDTIDLPENSPRALLDYLNNI